MSSTDDFTEDISFGNNNTPHHAPLPLWYQNYYAPGQSAISNGHSMPDLSNPFGLNFNHNFNNRLTSNLHNTSAFNPLNHYAPMRMVQPYQNFGHVNDMLLPFGQISQNQYYATPSFGDPSNMLGASPFMLPQQPIPSIERALSAAPTTPVNTVRLETISPDVLRGQYTRPIESDTLQPFAQTTNYDSSYRHFELDEHEHELSVPPAEPHDARARSQFSQTTPFNDEVVSGTEGCFAFAQCGNKNDEDLIGCRNGSCVVAFHPECAILGAREDGLPACPSCLSIVDSALLGQLNLGQHDRTTTPYSPPSRSQSASVRATQSPPRATPAPSIGSSFHPSPSPAVRRTPQKRAIKVESSSPVATSELFGSYKGSIAVPEGFVTARGLNNKGAWTAEEDAACIRVMRNLLEIHNGSRRIAIDTLWQRASEALAKEGIDRSSSGIKMQWTRRLRAQSGVDERAVPRPDLMCTGLLTKGIPRRKRAVEKTPPASPTTRRLTKKLRGTAAETNHLTATHVKNSRIVKLKIGAGTATANATGTRRSRGGPRKAKTKAQQKLEKVEDDVRPIEDPDEGVSMHGRAVTPDMHERGVTPGLQQEMDIVMDGYNGSPTSSFEDALEDTLMDRGYVMEE